MCNFLREVDGLIVFGSIRGCCWVCLEYEDRYFPNAAVLAAEGAMLPAIHSLHFYDIARGSVV